MKGNKKITGLVDMFAPSPVVRVEARRITPEEKTPVIIQEGDEKPIVDYEVVQSQPIEYIKPRTNSYPIYITVKSDGNILQLVGNKNKILTYKYVKSQTKLNELVTFTEELLEKFIEVNR